MALIEDVAEGIASPAGLVAGIGAVLLAPMLAPAMRTGLRPAAKAVLRTGITLYRDTVEPIAGAVKDLVTEAQLELASASAAAAAAPTTEEHGKAGRHKRHEGGKA